MRLDTPICTLIPRSRVSVEIVLAQRQNVIALNTMVVVTNAFKLPYQFEGKIASLALGSALLVGVGAGFSPALRASQLDPVKALRSE